MFTIRLKNASNAQLQRCGPPQNAHILPCMLRFFVGPRSRRRDFAALNLLLGRDLHF